MTKENHKYKDSVFCDLFYTGQDAKANLVSLCNALHDTHYKDETMIGLVRLEDLLFQEMKNDIAFLAGKRQIFLGEHQSTINGNMPLRSHAEAVRRVPAGGGNAAVGADRESDQQFKLHGQGKEAGEIAKILQISEEQVRLILS